MLASANQITVGPQPCRGACKRHVYQLDCCSALHAGLLV
jgi:hypothetical protein